MRRILVGCLILAVCSLSCKFFFPDDSSTLGPFGRLDDETLNRLVISIGESSQAQPGDRMELQVGTNECCYVFNPLPVQVRWSIEPAEGASIDPRSGALTVSPDAKAGQRYTVSADIEKGRRVLTAAITIYTPGSNSLVGIWHESQQIACDTGQTSPAQEGMRELLFKADGVYKATFTPFEIYHDYWGSYTFDLQAGTLSLSVDGGNYVPTDLDLQGTFEITADGALWLKSIWLGRRDLVSQVGCGHVFVK